MQCLTSFCFAAICDNTCHEATDVYSGNKYLFIFLNRAQGTLRTTNSETQGTNSKTLFWNLKNLLLDAVLNCWEKLVFYPKFSFCNLTVVVVTLSFDVSSYF